MVQAGLGAAYAQQIVAGALQDHRRATVIATRTYGKGAVQTTYAHRDGRLRVAPLHLAASAATIRKAGEAGKQDLDLPQGSPWPAPG